jgi:hypothetical protein
MRFMTAGGNALAAMIALSSGGCEDKQRSVVQQSVSYSSRDPGSSATPTHETSFWLLGVDGPSRLASLQALIVRSGKPCVVVTRAVLKGGLDGTDEWRVNCADSGDWAIWFRPGQTDILR